mmetsp:Transcript_18711/g.28683  ORF Transcript_18711/g.28683 Transcript_18711/m.28683 type:complete len:237 (-) Transcript_18711:1148-1858(-)
MSTKRLVHRVREVVGHRSEPGLGGLLLLVHECRELCDKGLARCQPCQVIIHRLALSPQFFNFIELRKSVEVLLAELLVELALTVLGFELVHSKLLFPDPPSLFGYEEALLVPFIELGLLQIIYFSALLLNGFAVGEGEVTGGFVNLILVVLANLSCLFRHQAVVDSEDLKLLAKRIAVVEELVVDNLLLKLPELVALLHNFLNFGGKIFILLSFHLVADVLQELLLVLLLEYHFLA